MQNWYFFQAKGSLSLAYNWNIGLSEMNVELLGEPRAHRFFNLVTFINPTLSVGLSVYGGVFDLRGFALASSEDEVEQKIKEYVKRLKNY